MKVNGFVLFGLFVIGGCAPMYAAPAAVSNPISVDKAEIAFTQAGEHPEKLLIQQIQVAKTSIDAAVYSFTLPEIKDEMIKAHKRGVTVRVISDRQQSGGKYQKEVLQDMEDAGIPVKINKHSGLMHLKLNVFDGESFTIGSFNETKAASTVNDEVLMLVHNQEGAQECEKQFNRLWDDQTALEDFQ